MSVERSGSTAGVGRRAFLQSAPRRLFEGVRLLHQGLSGSSIASEAKTNQFVRCIAVIDVARCLAWGGTACQACYVSCPRREEAFWLHDGRPAVVVSGCDGCGVCVEACGAVNDLRAIRLLQDAVGGGV